MPLILFSIPMAYLGGRFQIEENTFFIILGFTLMLSSILMLISKDQTKIKKLPRFTNGLLGGGIGLLSGLVGIGGGIFLSPVLHISKWSSPKIIAATTALFILVNSMAGLTGQLITNGLHINIYPSIVLMITVFIGGQIGSSITIKKLNPITVKKMTGILIIIVSLRILYKYLF